MVVWLFCSGFNSVMTINDRCMVAGAGEGGEAIFIIDNGSTRQV